MKYLKKFESLDVNEYNVKLWCYNSCKQKDEWLSSSYVPYSVVINTVKEYRKEMKEYEHTCRRKFWITVNNKMVTTLKKLEIKLDIKKYNL